MEVASRFDNGPVLGNHPKVQQVLIIEPIDGTAHALKSELLKILGDD
jgi:hypothetical protein